MELNLSHTTEKVYLEGEKLYKLLSQANLKSCKLIKENLEKLEHVNSVIIVGSSWSGKTTIRNKLVGLSDVNFSFPKRVITREQRPNDNLDENEFAKNLEDLKLKVEGGLIWKRDLGEKIEYYGFKKSDNNSFPIYSANNALIRGKRELLQEPGTLVDNSLILLVYAPDEERIDRNTKREGNYLESKPLQKEIRASDTSLSLADESHIIIENSNNQDNEVQYEDLKKILATIKELKKGNVQTNKIPIKVI